MVYSAQPNASLMQNLCAQVPWPTHFTAMNALMALTASPSCCLSSSVALGLVRSSSSTCAESRVSQFLVSPRQASSRARLTSRVTSAASTLTFLRSLFSVALETLSLFMALFRPS